MPFMIICLFCDGPEFFVAKQFLCQMIFNIHCDQALQAFKMRRKEVFRTIKNSIINQITDVGIDIQQFFFD